MSNSLMNLIAVIAAGFIVLGIIHLFIPLPGFLKFILNIAVLGVMVVFVLQYLKMIETIIPMPKLF